MPTTDGAQPRSCSLCPAAPQVANQPGLEDVFADLLEYEDRCAEEKGAEFYMDTIPEHLEGGKAL